MFLGHSIALFDVAQADYPPSLRGHSGGRPVHIRQWRLLHFWLPSACQVRSPRPEDVATLRHTPHHPPPRSRDRCCRKTIRTVQSTPRWYYMSLGTLLRLGFWLLSWVLGGVSWRESLTDAGGSPSPIDAAGLGPATIKYRGPERITGASQFLPPLPAWTRVPLFVPTPQIYSAREILACQSFLYPW